MAFQLEKSFLKRLYTDLATTGLRAGQQREMIEHKGCVYIHVYMYTHTHTYLAWKATVFKHRIFHTESAKKWLTGASSITSLASNLFSHFWGHRVHWDDSKVAEELHVLAPGYCWQNSSRQRHVRGMDPDHQAPGDIRVPVPQKLSAEDMHAHRLQEGVRQPTLKKL